MEKKQTPLWSAHRSLGARMIDFGGWDMPVSYPAGTIAEHRAVRTAAGLFDVSHMGEVYLRGPGARGVVDRLTTNNVAGAPVGKAVYTLLCVPSGGIVDDCIFYKLAEDEFFVIVNASNVIKDVEWMRDQAHSECEIDDVSDERALIAVQGPQAVTLVDGIADSALAALPGFGFANAKVGGVAAFVARTGYTGEDGFELCCSNADAPALWAALLEAATPRGGLPIGLAARDSLRLEAKLPLYGNDLDEDHTPLEAGLGWAVKLEGREFIGAAALREQKRAGLQRKLVGFRIDPALRAIARHGYPVVDRTRTDDDNRTTDVIGIVTSGGTGIHVGGSIGLAYVPVAKSAPGTQLTIDCRGKDVSATVVEGKFYQRASAKG